MGRAAEKEKPLVEDIRLLGRILGEVIKKQDGPAMFDLIERIRTLSLAFRRDGDKASSRELTKLLASRSTEEAIRVIRAFTYFSHLANLAEDRHYLRRRELHERLGNAQEGSIDVALSRLRWAGLQPAAVAQALAGASCGSRACCA